MYIQACMHTHTHVCMHVHAAKCSYTHVCMHAHANAHIHLHPDMKIFKIKASDLYEKNRYIHVILLQMSEVNEEFLLLYCLKAIRICIHKLNKYIVKIKAIKNQIYN